MAGPFCSKSAPHGELLPSATRVASTVYYSPILVNDGRWTGFMMTMNASAIVGTPSVVPTVQIWDAAQGWTTYATCVARTAAVVTIALLHPTFIAAGVTLTDEIQSAVPYQFRVAFTHSAAATSMTYAVAYQFVM